MPTSNTNMAAEMSEGEWKTARELRIEEAREKLRHLMVAEPEAVVDLILGSVDGRISVLRQRLADLEIKVLVLEVHQHKGKAILAPLPLSPLIHKTMGLGGNPQSAEPSWASIMMQK